MKKIVFLLLIHGLMFSQISQSQLGQMNFEPGEIIVKLKDNVDTNITYRPDGKAISDFNIGQLLGIENKVATSNIMFHQKSIAASLLNKQKMKKIYASKMASSPNNGYISQEPMSMKNVFVLKTNNIQEDIFQLIEQIKDNPNVDYAEPNYRFSIENFKIEKIITAEEATKLSTLNQLPPITPNDPLFSSQSNIVSTNIDDVWGEYTTGNGSQIIAILDTGVDYTHPDLGANIWSNSAEANGVPGYDDDGNGFIDDVKGWDFINVDNAPLDDNMHGTHVAGIAGAVGNNGIGIAGAVWNAKLMPIKVFQATGQGNSSTIAEGVEYAVDNGATVINMSFGSFSESLILKSAVENAYSSALLVAASGNNGTNIGPCPGCKPFYPAAYHFVLGVEDSMGTYDNYDGDGPLFSNHAGQLNYEIKSPGSNIMSTIPNGGYARLTGSSMAAPLLAGSCAIYNQVKSNSNREILFGDFINSSSQNNFNLLAALNTNPNSIIKLYQVAIDDNIQSNQYRDGFINAGETINIFSSVRNFWGTSGNIQMSIEFGGNQLQNTYFSSIVNITDNSSSLPPLSNYAFNINTSNPFTITVNSNVPHNTEVIFKISAWDINNPTQIDVLEYKINIKNIQKIIGPINNNITIYPGKYVIDEMVIVDNATVTIMPGVEISFEANGRFKRLNSAIINAIGTRENMIRFTRGGLLNNGTVLEVNNCDWCEIKGGNVPNGAYAYFELMHADSRNNNYDHTIFLDDWRGFVAGNVSNSNVYGGLRYNQICQFNNIIEGSVYFGVSPNSNLLWKRPGGLGSPQNTSYIVNGNLFAGNGNNIRSVDNVFVPLLGNTELLNDWIIWDLIDASGNSFPNSNSDILTTGNMRSTPFEETPPFLWKLKINNKLAYYSPDRYYRNTTNSFKNPQYDPNIFQSEPIGIGTHEIKLYFNHSMDTSVNPLITYGVVEPYTQKMITEQGNWSSDGKVYTVNHVIGIGSADGINRIRVSGAKDLIYRWQIPEDQNHHFTLQSAGSASTGFLATPGLGKIILDWEAPSSSQLNDALGYNMYRYTANSNGTFTTPVKINSSLITEDTNPNTTGVSYTDFNVVEGQTYYYKYKILRTSFEETDFSQTISASPLTSLLGDSNGDFDVNVMDLVHDVDYILGNNPTPFIFLAADINADQTINVLDIVGTVDIINVPPPPGGPDNSETSSADMNFYPNNPIGYATFSWEGNDLYVESEHNIGGLQLAFNSNFDYIISPELGTIERLDYIQDNNKIVMLYSFNNASITNGKTKILTRSNALQELNIEKAVVGTTVGKKLTAVFKNNNLNDIVAPLQSDSLEFINMVPNPTDGLITLEYYLPEDMDGATASVYDMIGRLVFQQKLNKTKGLSQTQLELGKLSPANYIVLITAEKNGGIKHIANKKLIIK